MYFIRIQPLKDRLRERAMSDREALPYYVIFMACIALVCALPRESKAPSIWDVLTAATGMLLTIAGVVYSYVQNGGRTGYDFIQKSIVLGWVLTIRLLVFMMLVGGVLVFLKWRLGHPFDESSWVDILSVVLFQVIYFQRLGKHLKATNNVNGEQ